MIFKIVRRSMFKKWGLLLSIFILVLLSTMFIGLRHFTYDAMESSFETMTQKTAAEDFRLYTIPLLSKEYTQTLLDKIEEEQKVNLEKKEQITYNPNDTKKTAYQIMPYEKDSQYNQIILDEGTLPEKAGQIVVQPGYLKETNQKIGDEISIEGKTYEISGTSYFIDSVYPVSLELQMFIPDYTKFAPIYMNEQTYNNIEQTSKMVESTYYVGKFSNSISQKEEDEVYKKIENNYSVDVPQYDASGNIQLDNRGKLVTKEVNLFPFSLDYDDNISMSGVEQEVEKSKTMFNFLSIILTVLTIFLAISLVNSIFKAQRREMGILKAEGVSIGKLSFGFTAFIGILLLTASSVGLIFSFPLSQWMTTYYGTLFQIYHYPITFEIYGITILTSILIIAITLVCIYFISISRNLKQETLLLIKNIDKEKAPKFNITKHFTKLGFKTKYQINIIMRNFSKTIFLFFGILFSSFLLLLGILMYTAVTSMVNNTYSEKFTYSYLVNYSQNDVVKQSDNTFIDTKATLYEYTTDKETQKPESTSETVNIQTYDMNKTDYVHLENHQGQIIKETNGLIATDGFLKKYNMEIGDSLTIVNPYETDQKVTMKIEDSTSDFFLPYVFSDTDYLQQKLELPKDFSNSEYFGDKLTAEKKSEIKDRDVDAFIYETQDMKEMMGDQMQIVTTMIGIIAVFASLIAFITLYSISSIIIDSNRKTISVMKVLGYSNNEIKKMTIGVYKWFVIVIYIALIPVLNYIIQATVDKALADADFSLKINLNIYMSLLGLILIFLIYLLSSNLTFRKIKKIKLAESLKSDE